MFWERETLTRAGGLAVKNDREFRRTTDEGRNAGIANGPHRGPRALTL